jgi:hypothetical protein
MKCPRCSESMISAGNLNEITLQGASLNQAGSNLNLWICVFCGVMAIVPEPPLPMTGQITVLANEELSR